jgi:hypothetical protein
MGNKRTRRYPKKTRIVRQPYCGGDENDNTQETALDSEDTSLNDINREITSTVRAVSSRRELHSLVLMVFLFTVDQYIEQEDTFGNLLINQAQIGSCEVNKTKSNELISTNNLHKLIGLHYTKSKHYYEGILQLSTPFKFGRDRETEFLFTESLSPELIEKIVAPVLYKKEIIKFAHKIAYIIGQYHKLLNTVFYSDHTKDDSVMLWGRSREKELPVIKHSLTLLDSEIEEGIKKIREMNIIKRITETISSGTPSVRVKLHEQLTTAKIDNQDLGKNNESSTDNKGDVETTKNTNHTTSAANTETDAQTREKENLNKQKQPTDDIKGKIGNTFKLIEERMRKLTDSNGQIIGNSQEKVKCIDIYTFYKDPDNHPYYPRPMNTDWIYGDVDELIRYAAVYTQLLEIVMEKYEKIDKNDNCLKTKMPDVFESKKKREDYMIARGANHIGDSQMHSKAVSVMRGIGTIGKVFTGKTGGTRRDRIRKVMKLSKRIKRNPHKFIRVNKTVKRTGGDLLTATKNAAVYATKKVGKVIDTQSGLTKLANRTVNLYGLKDHEKIYFNINHVSKYEFMLYLNYMFELFKVNGFDAGDVLEGQELGLSPRVKEFLENVKAEELKEIDDEVKILNETKEFYVNNVDRSMRILNGIDEVQTQGSKLASAMMRAKNGQLRIYEESAKMMKNTFKSLRTLVGFMNKNGVIGYAIGILHFIANTGPYLSVAFPPLAMISLGAAALRTGLLIVASPILQPPTVILRKKEDIMRVAQSMMRLDFKQNADGNGDWDGSVNESNNFLKKIMEYYDVTRFVKTESAFSFTVLLKKDANSKVDNRITRDDNTRFLAAIEKVKEELKFMNITNGNITPEEEFQVSRYYLAQYSADNNKSMYNACYDVIDIANQESPFRNYLDYLKVRNKEYVLNEIYKLQLLLKICFLDAIRTDKMLSMNVRKLNYISDNMNDIILEMRKFYKTLYDQSRRARSYILGSPENLEQNFKELDINVRQLISKFCELNKDELSTIRGVIPKQFNDQMNKFVELQMGKTMHTRNATSQKVTQPGELDQIITYNYNHNQDKYNMFKVKYFYRYVYDKTCESHTGMHFSSRTVNKMIGKTVSKTIGVNTNVSLEYADLCKMQEKFKKRIRQYMVAAAWYAINYKKPTISLPSNNRINYNALLQLFIYMQHFAKRAYIEGDGTILNGIVPTKFKFTKPKYGDNKLGTNRYIYWYIDTLNQNVITSETKLSTNIKQLIQKEVESYMIYRYIYNKYKLQLTLANDTPSDNKIIWENMKRKTIEILKTYNVFELLDSNNNTELQNILTTDYDVAGDIEKQLLNSPEFKLKTMDVYAPTPTPQKSV